MAGNHREKILVSVSPRGALASRPLLFAALTAAFPVEFVAAAPAASAEIRIGEAPFDQPPKRRALVFATTPRRDARAGTVEVGADAAIDRRLRGTRLPDPLDGGELETGAGEEVLARHYRRPVWTRSRSGGKLERIASALPELGPEQSLRDLLVERPLALVPLIGLLREIAGDGFAPPPLRAAFLFDDPNLRWRSYGFIDYGRLLVNAEEHCYHAAMAMIPLDAGRQHAATVDLFRHRRERLSLVLHGNNHLARELARPRTDRESLAIAAQALRRAAAFEARNALPIDRVMTPPHGMCSASSARALASLGYDALCAIHPIPWREREVPPGRPLTGWGPAEFAAGCAVIPRMPLGVGVHELALRAFLDQPLILYGHHDDLADGLDLLAETAHTINRLGDVRWTSLGKIAATNAATRLDGTTLRVRPYAHRLRVSVAAGTEAIAVEAPAGDPRCFAGWSVDDSSRLPFGTEAAIAGTGPRLIRLHPAVAVDPAGVPPSSGRLWPIVRRTATETRDRLAPLLPSSAR